MKNNYQLKTAKIIKVIEENSITKTFYYKFDDQEDFQFLAGQFMQIGVNGFGECPISISSNPVNAKKYLSLTIRAVGELTEKLNSMKKGDTVQMRGPFGNGFPEVTTNLILIGGGCGYIPLRSVYEENKKRKDIKMQVFIGCRNQDSLVFTRDYRKMNELHDLKIILEKEKVEGLSKEMGFVTDLIKNSRMLTHAKIFICGPQIMYKFVVQELLKKKEIMEDSIYLSLEKRMHCGLGVCQHCAIGSKYVCKDGPVFDYKYLKSVKYI